MIILWRRRSNSRILDKEGSEYKKEYDLREDVASTMNTACHQQRDGV